MNYYIPPPIVSTEPHSEPILPSPIVNMPDSPMIDQQEANESSNQKTSFPQTRVKAIMKADKDVQLVSGDSVYAMSIAAELFLEILAKEALVYTRSEGRKTVHYKDVSKAVASISALEFLEGSMSFL